MNHVFVTLLILLLAAQPKTAGGGEHPFLPIEVVHAIKSASIVRAYQLAQLPREATNLGYLCGSEILRPQAILDAEQTAFLKWVVSSDRAHCEVPNSPCECRLPTMGFRFVSKKDSVDVTVDPECLSTWTFAMSRGLDYDHVNATSSSFVIVRPEMLTLLGEIFLDNEELQRELAISKGAPYRSNWPLQLPASTANE